MTLKCIKMILFSVWKELANGLRKCYRQLGFKPLIICDGWHQFMMSLEKYPKWNSWSIGMMQSWLFIKMHHQSLVTENMPIHINWNFEMLGGGGKIQLSSIFCHSMLICHYIGHMMAESERVMKGTIYEKIWMVYNDALSLMTAKSTK